MKGQLTSLASCRNRNYEKLIALLICTLASLFVAKSQGTFIFDQQSSVDGSYLEGAVLDLQAVQPFGQSFTPSLTSVGFVRFYLYDSYTPNTLPGTLYVNLRAGSITGQVLGTSTPVTLAPHFNGLVDFFFQTPVSLTPQTTYFLQPVVQSGNRWGIFADTYNYPGGTQWSQGAAVPSRDLWFREGIVIPEPSTTMLGLLGIAAVALARRALASHQRRSETASAAGPRRVFAGLWAGH